MCLVVGGRGPKAMKGKGGACLGFGFQLEKGKVFGDIHRLEAIWMSLMESCWEQGHRPLSKGSCKDRAYEFSEVVASIQPEQSLLHEIRRLPARPGQRADKRPAPRKSRALG